MSKACSKGEKATRASYVTKWHGQILCKILYTEANLFDMASVEAGVKQNYAYIGLRSLLTKNHYLLGKFFSLRKNMFYWVMCDMIYLIKIQICTSAEISENDL